MPQLVAQDKKPPPERLERIFVGGLSWGVPGNGGEGPRGRAGPCVLIPSQIDSSRPLTHRSPAGGRVSHQPGCAHPPSSQGRPPATPVCGGGGSSPLAQASRPCLITPRGQGLVMLCPWAPSHAGVSSSLSSSSVLPPLPALLLR